MRDYVRLANQIENTVIGNADRRRRTTNSGREHDRCGEHVLFYRNPARTEDTPPPPLPVARKRLVIICESERPSPTTAPRRLIIDAAKNEVSLEESTAPAAPESLQALVQRFTPRPVQTAETPRLRTQRKIRLSLGQKKRNKFALQGKRRRARLMERLELLDVRVFSAEMPRVQVVLRISTATNFSKLAKVERLMDALEGAAVMLLHSKKSDT